MSRARKKEKEEEMSKELINRRLHLDEIQYLEVYWVSADVKEDENNAVSLVSVIWDEGNEQKLKNQIAIWEESWWILKSSMTSYQKNILKYEE